MAWIATVSDNDARGPLKKHFNDAIRRAGRVYNIVRLMSPNPAALKASMDFYLALMFGPSPLSRAQRELLATVVSRANRCRY
jgi:uncharacterized peroxidase-related enzyme